MLIASKWGTKNRILVRLKKMKSKILNDMYDALKLPTFNAYENILRMAAQIRSQSFPDPIFKDRPKVPCLPGEEEVARFIARWDIFWVKQVYVELWKDLAEEGLALLKEMLETGQFDFEKNPKCQDFDARVVERVRKVAGMPEYRGAWDGFS